MKAHKGIEGNEQADQGAKRGSEAQDQRERVTEGGIKQAVSAGRKAEREQDGWGKDRVVRWSRWACTLYSYLRQGSIRVWKKKIGKIEDDRCRSCEVPETGEHVVFRCESHGGLRFKWIPGCEIWGTSSETKSGANGQLSFLRRSQRRKGGTCDRASGRRV